MSKVARFSEVIPADLKDEIFEDFDEMYAAGVAMTEPICIAAVEFRLPALVGRAPGDPGGALWQDLVLVMFEKIGHEFHHDWDKRVNNPQGELPLGKGVSLKRLDLPVQIELPIFTKFVDSGGVRRHKMTAIMSPAEFDFAIRETQQTLRRTGTNQGRQQARLSNLQQARGLAESGDLARALAAYQAKETGTA